MTPQRIADISEPIEQLYSDLTDELLLNIAKHLSRSTATWTALHEIETLADMGQLTQENIEIINTYVKKMPQEIKDAMNESRLEALEEIEKTLAEAAEKGFLTPPVTDSTVDVVKALSQQAAEQLNMVNQTMLNNSLEQFRNGIYRYREEMKQAAIRTIETDTQLELAQNEINIAAGKVATGTETRNKAMRKCILEMNKAGITGFYDRLDRAWTAEAYVNMNIRTTVHNTYIESVKDRQQDYGSDVFQVSSHAGARPLCYPYQGKLYSWGMIGGTITLGNGKTYKYEPISTTSYGEAAGLFGINCGHVPYPMIAGVSEPVKEKIYTKKENDRQYQESQEQRALERQIRYEKRAVEMLGHLATPEDKQRIRDAQARMREFIDRTGRTRRYDREQIVTKRYEEPTAVRPTIRTPIKPVTEEPKIPLNKYGQEILIDLQPKKTTGNLARDERAKARADRSETLIKNLANEYNSYVKSVTRGGIGENDVDIVGVMRVNALNTETIIHEFAHTLAQSMRVKAEIADEAEKEFLEEAKKVRRKYTAAWHKDTSELISAYSKESLEEFIAEAFSHAKMRELGYETARGYKDNESEYSKAILELADKYFKKE